MTGASPLSAVEGRGKQTRRGAARRLLTPLNGKQTLASIGKGYRGENSIVTGGASARSRVGQGQVKDGSLGCSGAGAGLNLDCELARELVRSWELSSRSITCG